MPFGIPKAGLMLCHWFLARMHAGACAYVCVCVSVCVCVCVCVCV